MRGSAVRRVDKSTVTGALPLIGQLVRRLMRKSVEQAVLDKDQKRPETVEWINSASVFELRDFMHSVGTLDPWFQRAQNALSIQLSDKQLKSAEILENHTKALVGFMEALLKETKLLRWLTVGLLVLTIGLFVFTVVLAIRN